MSLTLHIVHAKDFLRTTTQGELDLAASKRVLLNIAEAAECRPGCEILMDFRSVTSVRLSVTDIWELAVELDRRKSFRATRTALLVRGTGERAEFFKLCAENRGYHIHVFRDFEEAIDWLFSATSLPMVEAPGH